MADLRGHLLMLFGSAVGSGVVAWFVYRWFDDHFGHATFHMKLGGVFIPMAIGCGVCFGLAFAMRVPYVQDIFAMLPARFRPKKANPPA